MTTPFPLFLKESRDGVLLEIHVQPQASKTEIKGLHGDRLKIRVHAPPVDGAANSAICDFLAILFKCAKQNVSVIHGQSSRQKTIRIVGSTASHIAEAIAVSLKG